MRGGKKASAKLFRNAPRPWFVFIFLLSSKKKNELEAASSTAHSFALLKDNELPVPIAFALAFFFSISHAEFYAVNSWNAQLDKRKRQSGSLPCSPLPEHECITATCIEPLGFLFA